MKRSTAIVLTVALVLEAVFVLWVCNLPAPSQDDPPAPLQPLQIPAQPAFPIHRLYHCDFCKYA